MEISGFFSFPVRLASIGCRFARPTSFGLSPSYVFPLQERSPANRSRRLVIRALEFVRVTRARFDPSELASLVKQMES